MLIAKTRRPKEALLFCAAAHLVLAPWLAATWKATGDPVWPFLRISPEAADLAARYLRSNRWDFPPSFGVFLQDGPGFLALPAIGLWLLTRGRTPKAEPLERWLWAAAPAYAVLSWRHNEAWRFMMPIWPALVLAASRAMAASCVAGGVRRAAAIGLVAVAVVPIAALSPNNALFAVLGAHSVREPDAEPRDLFLRKSVDVADFYRAARQILPPKADVLLFREVRGYGAGFKYRWGDPMNQAAIDYARIANADDLAVRLKALGVTHVLDHSGSHLYGEDPAYYSPRMIGLMERCLRAHARLVLAGEGISLYELF